MARNVVFDQQLAGVREEFREDAFATRFIHHFEAMVEYIECCLSESHSWAEEATREAIRVVMEQCSGDSKRDKLQISLLWVLRTRYQHMINVKHYVHQLEEANRLR